MWQTMQRGRVACAFMIFRLYEAVAGSSYYTYSHMMQCSCSMHDGWITWWQDYSSGRNGLKALILCLQHHRHGQRPLPGVHDNNVRDWGLDFIRGGLLWAGFSALEADQHVSELRPVFMPLRGPSLLRRIADETESREHPLLSESFQNIFGCGFWEYRDQLASRQTPGHASRSQATRRGIWRSKH